MKDVVLHQPILLSILLMASTPLSVMVSAEELVIVGQPMSDAVWQSITAEGEIIFRNGTTVQQVPLEKLVRWSTPAANYVCSEAILADGSRIVLADSWGGKSSLELVNEKISLATESLGEFEISPAQLRAVLLNAPTDALRRTRFLSKLLSDTTPLDQVYLTNGDALSGRVTEISASTTAGETMVLLLMTGQSEPVEIPKKKIAGICWKKTKNDGSESVLVVGLRDGSCLDTKSLSTADGRFSAKLACGVSVSGEVSDVVHFRSLGSHVIYVSDVEPDDYRHEPYLDIEWPYRRDRNVLGGPLVVKGHTYANGVGVTTAARLSYQVPPDRVRFAASVAIDDAAEGRGSVVFRVYVRNGEDWQLAFSSPVVRGGETPQAVTADLAGAREIALVDRLRRSRRRTRLRRLA